MKADSPLVTRVLQVLTFASLAAGAVGAWWYVVDERNRSIEQIAYLRDVRADQGAIRRELSLQTETLREIRADQGRIVDRQRWLASEINALAFDAGAHAQRHAAP